MNDHLRILVVLPMYGGSLPVGRCAARGLSELGHIVETLDAPAFHPAFTALKSLRVSTERLDQLENSFLGLVSQAVLAKVEQFRPDLVLALAQAPLSRQALKRLRQDGVPTVMWFVEDHRLFTYWQTFAPWYDFFFVIQKSSFLEKLASLGVTNAFYLPLAAQPDIHRPLDLGPVERRRFGSDLSFMGAGYPNRRLAFRDLAGMKFRIWGTEWEGDPVLEPLVQNAGARVGTEDAVRIFNATHINLNLHSSINAKQAVVPGDFINPRTFEIASCGAFQLVDRRSLLPELFESDEMITFASMKELRDLVDHYLPREEERQSVAARARKRVLAEHTYAHRMATLLETVARHRPDWPRPQKADPVRNLGIDPELGREVEALVAELGLPEDVSFPDLAWAVRQRSGRLSPLETSILFLDEWKKLYAPKSG
ncbi:MAG: hypothetical protein EOM25_10240 [Deltaproteobacteria bacterium]|nr:hypothetical protein [Deltaproteobacteria bacterium]